MKKAILFLSLSMFCMAAMAQKKDEPKKEEIKVEQPKIQLTDSTLIQVLMNYSEFKKLLADMDANIDSRKAYAIVTNFLQQRAFIIADKPKDGPAVLPNKPKN